MEPLVNALTGLLLLYFALGWIFGLLFIFKGVQVIDSAAQGAKWRFRLFILPGVAAFWPLLLKRWLGGTKEPPVETNAHRQNALQGGAS